MLILFLRRFTYGFTCSFFWRDVEATILRFLGEYGGPLFPGRIVLLAPNLARPRPAAPPGAPTRPARGMSGFWIRQVEKICHDHYRLCGRSLFLWFFKISGYAKHGTSEQPNLAELSNCYLVQPLIEILS